MYRKLQFKEARMVQRTKEITGRIRFLKKKKVPFYYLAK